MGDESLNRIFVPRFIFPGSNHDLDGYGLKALKGFIGVLERKRDLDGLDLLLT